MIEEQASDIVALLIESGTRTRRERAAFVARLRDEMGLNFTEIGRQINVSPQRAQQLYRLHQYFQRSAKSPFANLSTRARHFLDNVAVWKRLGPDWEQNPDKINQVVQALTQMSKTEAFKFRQLGQRTFQEIADFMKQRGVRFPYEFTDALDDQEFDPKLLGEKFQLEGVEDEGELGGKDLTRATDMTQAMELVVQFMNEKGWRGEFKAWPRGTYRGPYAENAEFVITLSGFLADAWEEHWSGVEEFDVFVKGLGLHYEMATRSVITFYHDPYFEADNVPIPQRPEQPPINLKDINLD